jgi:hypothetical protein
MPLLSLDGDGRTVGHDTMDRGKDPDNALAHIARTAESRVLV